MIEAIPQNTLLVIFTKELYLIAFSTYGASWLWPNTIEDNFSMLHNQALC